MARKGPVVKTQMGGFSKPSLKGGHGIYDAAPAPFNHPHSLGGGGIPVLIMESGPGKTPTPMQTAGKETRAPRPGTVQRKYGKSNT